jgi:serine/threonine-protein kinase
MGETITQIGRYEISRQLVDTALASVYDAFDPVERKPVAIRVPRTTRIRGTGAVSLGLKHPGLMTVLSYEESQGAAFMVLEPFAGKPLDSHIPAGARMDPAEVVGLLRQLASALDYAHAHGAIHGSLHPSSILLNDRQEIKVLDLGPSDTAGRNASAEQLLRAVHFLSPESISDAPMDGRSDQFSLAVLAHLMLTGALPFPGTPLGVLFRIAYQPLERDAMRDLPPAAQAVFRRSLAKTPAERYATCGEMLDALENALLRPAVLPTRVADAAQFIPAQPVAPAPPVGGAPAQQSWAARNLSGEALKYFGVTFVVCALILAAVLYFLLPGKVRPNAVPATPAATPAAAPAVTQPAAPVAAPAEADQPAIPEEQAAPPPSVKAKGSRSRGGRRKAEPQVEFKPVEPKIIRQ